jgi:hypothetical protein
MLGHLCEQENVRPKDNRGANPEEHSKEVHF